jgi:hypothetical protein
MQFNFGKKRIMAVVAALLVWMAGIAVYMLFGFQG